MLSPALQKRLVDQYYHDLATYKEQHVTHETAVRSAFQNLLASFAPSVNWTLIPEEPLANGKRPDGTLRDTFRLPRGYWEAKDTRDDLPTEIRKKTAIGYPTTNTIFYVSNNSFIDQIAFDGMRKHLLQDFTHIYHLDLHGNVRKNPKLSGTTHNVFGIQVGVGITIAIRASQSETRTLCYYRVPEFWRRREKLDFLASKGSITHVEWETLQPDAKHTWLTAGMRTEFDSFLPLGTKEQKRL